MNHASLRSNGKSKKQWPDINNSGRQMPYKIRAPRASAETLERAIMGMDAMLLGTNAHVRSGSCVTSIAGPNGGAQLYER
jgi:hypothetical protein